MTRSTNINQWKKEREAFEADVKEMTNAELKKKHEEMLAVPNGTRWRITLEELRRRTLAHKWKYNSVTWRRKEVPDTADLIHTSTSEGGRVTSEYFLDGYRIYRRSDHWQEVGLISGHAWKLANRREWTFGDDGIETGYADIRRLAKTGVDWAITLLDELNQTTDTHEPTREDTAQ